MTHFGPDQISRFRHQMALSQKRFYINPATRSITSNGSGSVVGKVLDLRLVWEVPGSRPGKAIFFFLLLLYYFYYFRAPPTSNPTILGSVMVRPKA